MPGTLSLFLNSFETKFGLSTGRAGLCTGCSRAVDVFVWGGCGEEEKVLTTTRCGMGMRDGGVPAMCRFWVIGGILAS